MYQRDDYTCQNCGAMGGPQGHAELHAHHIVPKSRGGTHATSNLISLCSECHNTVHSKSKQAPAPRQPVGGTGVDYGELSDAIVTDIANILAIVGEGIEVGSQPNLSTIEKANNWQTIANEIRPLVLDITDGAEMLESMSTANYPRELVQHDKKLIDEGIELCLAVLELVEYGGEKMMEVAEDQWSCPGCGQEVNIEEQDFCVNCGEELSLGQNCEDCGEEVLPTDDFCASCGAEVEVTEGREVAKKAKELESELEEMMIEVAEDAEEFNPLIDQRHKIIEKHSQF